MLLCLSESRRRHSSHAGVSGQNRRTGKKYDILERLVGVSCMDVSSFQLILICVYLLLASTAFMYFAPLNFFLGPMSVAVYVASKSQLPEVDHEWKK